MLFWYVGCVGGVYVVGGGWFYVLYLCCIVFCVGIGFCVVVCGYCVVFGW